MDRSFRIKTIAMVACSMLLLLCTCQAKNQRRGSTSTMTTAKTTAPTTMTTMPPTTTMTTEHSLSGRSKTYEDFDVNDLLDLTNNNNDDDDDNDDNNNNNNNNIPASKPPNPSGQPPALPLSLPLLHQPRPGAASDESSCSSIKQRLPGTWRRVLPPESKEFYSKYTEAYRIPVMSHSSVPDAALRRACYVLRFLLADRSDLRQAFYSKWGRIVVLGKDKHVHDLPEYRTLNNPRRKNNNNNNNNSDDSKVNDDDDYYLLRSSRLKTIAASDSLPVAVAPEENLLCHEARAGVLLQRRRHHHHHHARHLFRKSARQKHQRTESDLPPAPPGQLMPVSRSMPDDVSVKTVAVSILNIAVKEVNPELKQRLDRAYRHAMASGLWKDTESTHGPQSYFGEGVQSFYDANAYSSPADGFNNDINLRTKLRSYDTALYAIVHQVFPCANSYQTRCSSRGNEAHLHFEVECRIPHWQR